MQNTASEICRVTANDPEKCAAYQAGDLNLRFWGVRGSLARLARQLCDMAGTRSVSSCTVARIA